MSHLLEQLMRGHKSRRAKRRLFVASVLGLMIRRCLYVDCLGNVNAQNV